MSRRMMSMALGSLALCGLMATAGAQVEDRPDLSGLWTPALGRGAVSWPADPPYTDWGRARWEAYVTEFDEHVDEPGRFCVHPGMPRSMIGTPTFPIEVFHRPHDVTLFMEAYYQYRKIYMDGYDRPPPILPTRMGYSVGRWEGDALVVETTHLAERLLGRSMLSDEAHISERIRIEHDEDGTKLLVNDITLTDPKMYREPVRLRGVWAWSPDTPVMEYVCSETIYEQHLESVRARRAGGAE